MKNDKTTKHQFSADRPIISHKEDLLGRAGFAESLASAIKSWTGHDSLVIALYGPWGSGKSSIKNIIIESLRISKEDCPYIVEFNPWQWAGQEQLAEAFFKEIGTVLGRADRTKGKKRAAKWRQYGTYLTVGASLIKSYKFVLPLLGIPETGIPEALASGLEESSKVSKEAAEMLSAQPDYNLNEIKDDLSTMLGTLKNPLLIVMDDIDRLSSGEIKLLFQLVKANADFPNMIYLLLFQRDIVEKSLEDISPITGSEFLEKIVQAGFDIPKIERSRLERVLCNGLDELLSDKIIEQRFDQNRWGNIFIPGLRHYFETLRDVHRFLATLSFHISLFRKTGSFEVNPIDLIAIEVLRVFEPEVYKQLHGAKSALTDNSDPNLSKDANDHTRNILEAIVNQAHQENRTHVKTMLKQLFPPMEWIYSGPIYGPDFREQWFRDLRVCHPDVFDRYFHLTIPEGDLSQADLDRILSLVGNREALVTEFHNLNRRGLLGIALDRLEVYKEKIDIQHAVPFIKALMDIGDELPNDPGGWFSIGPDTHATRIIYWYLKQAKDPEKRGQILKEAIRNTSGLYLPIMYTSIEGGRHNKQKDIDDFTVTENDVKELQEICVGKIRQAAAELGTLMSNSKMAYILYGWWKWTSPEEPRKWVTQLVESPKGALSFLMAFLSQSQSHGMGDYVYQTHWRISLKSIEDFVPVDIIEEKIKGLKVEEFSEKEQLAIRAFQKALKRREEGKLDDDWHDDDDE